MIATIKLCDMIVPPTRFLIVQYTDTISIRSISLPV